MNIFEFASHLTDNPAIIESIIAAAVACGQLSLLIAPCDAGKTYTILKEIAKAIPATRNIILAVPNVVQALQNAKYGANVVTGEKYVIKSDGKITSATYDKVRLLAEWDDDELANSTLVIDEAHMLVTEESYRHEAIHFLLIVARRIIKAGGSVILMTATPQRVQNLDFLCILQEQPQINVINCIRTDLNGKKVPGIKAKNIHVIRKPEDIKMPNFVLDRIRRNYSKGKKTLVMYNHKDTINRLERTIIESDLSVYRITADDKGFCQEPVYDSNGIVRRYINKYSNKTYGSLIEKECLLAADVWLCTSVVEAGVNIKGILTPEGESKEEDIVLIYVASNPSQFDLDKMHQFFARVRYPYNDAVVIIGASEKESDKNVDIEKLIKTAAENALIQEKKYGLNVANLRDVEGHKARNKIIYNGEEYVPNQLAIVAEIWKNKNKQIYHRDDIAKIIQDAVEVATTEEQGEPGEDHALSKRPELDEETCDALHRMIYDDAAYKHILNRMDPDCHIETIRELIKLKEGYRICTSAIDLAKICGNRAHLEAMVIADYNKEKIYVDGDSGKLVDDPKNRSNCIEIKEYYERKGLEILSGCTQKSLEKIIPYLQQGNGTVTSDTPIVLRDLKLNPDIGRIVRYFGGNDRMSHLLAVNEKGNFSKNLVKLMQIGASCSIDELKDLERELVYIALNNKGLKNEKLKKAQAEYMVLRHPEKYLIAKTDQGNVSAWILLGKGNKTMAEQYLSSDDIEVITECMADSVMELCRSKRRPQYKARDVYKTISLIYCVTIRDETEEIKGVPKKIEVKSLRKVLHQLNLG